jgi:tetratricopeptide (TPR) repeat protein
LARHNYGVTLLKLRQFQPAADQLGRAVAMQPDEQPNCVALGDALRLGGEAKAAGQAYSKAIKLNPHNDFAELARQSSTQLAQASFEGRTGGKIRPDAVQYCLGAIREFSGMSSQQVEALAFEIAMLGSGDGLRRPHPSKPTVFMVWNPALWAVVGRTSPATCGARSTGA